MGSLANKEMTMIRPTTFQEEEKPYLEKIEVRWPMQILYPGKYMVMIIDFINLHMCTNFVDKAAIIWETTNQASWPFMSMIINRTVTKESHHCCQIQL